MDLPDSPDQTWQDIQRDVRLNGAIRWVQQDSLPPLSWEFDAHTDVLPGVRVHHRSLADSHDIAVWEPANTNTYLVTRYGVLQRFLQSKDQLSEEMVGVLLLVGGAALLKALYTLFQRWTGTDTEEVGGSGVQQRPRPDHRQYNIFISHAWDYNDEYERVVEFLNEFESLDWQDHSVPLSDPLDTVNDPHLRARLRDQIRTTSVVLVLAGMYSAHREWIQTEIELAQEFDKPIIGIRPYGSQQTANVVEQAATEMVGWRQQSIVGAIVDHTE